ncbi:hypothetical protein NDU88_003553 [Pleurodeles waltl]|uniref:Uncharacterized protein n=1 Tax=Pleurodeles waltl TaxID=8319 RepID=A0AAV7UCE5_PLEWA|nr:hypothetical protein NDU88_003553 [Pleurodeles waltl]
MNRVVRGSDPGGQHRHSLEFSRHPPGPSKFLIGTKWPAQRPRRDVTRRAIQARGGATHRSLSSQHFKHKIKRVPGPLNFNENHTRLQIGYLRRGEHGFSHHNPEMPGLMEQSSGALQSDTFSGNKLRAPKDTDEEAQATKVLRNRVSTVELVLITQYCSEGNHNILNHSNLLRLSKALLEVINTKSDDIVRVAFKVLPEHSNHREATIMTLRSPALANMALIKKQFLDE